MGGEPTFVSIDDMDGEEWNTARAGPGQAQAAPSGCSTGCATVSRPGGLLHYRPGQMVPRRTAAALGA